MIARRALAALVVLLGLVGHPTEAEAQACTTVNPGPTFACVNGGWIPIDQLPSGPGLPPPSPPPAATSGVTFRQLAWGAGVSLGTVECLSHPPLILRPDGTFAGVVSEETRLSPPGLVWSGLGKIYQACDPNYAGPIILVWNLIAYTEAPFSDPYAPSFEVIRPTVHCGHHWIRDGIEIVAHNTTIRVPWAKGCRGGVLVERAVNVDIVGGNLVGNRNGIWLKGNGPTGLDGDLSITDIRIDGTRVSRSSQAAVLIGHGRAVSFDGVIVEGNYSDPIEIEPTWQGASISTVYLRDVWFEKNGGTNVVGSLSGVVAFEGSTATH